MSVFTKVSHSEAQALFDQYGLGPLVGIEGIAAGAENSNFFVHSDHQALVLTLFEKMDSSSLSWYLGLYQRLFANGLPVPQLWADCTGQCLQQVAGKPAVLMSRLPGQHWLAPDHLACYQIGQFLGRLHTQSPLMKPQSHHYSPSWCQSMHSWVPSAERSLYEAALAASDRLYAQALPKALIHADLFRDNALFVQGQLSGVLDWFFACHDLAVLDLGISLNDWCQDRPDLAESLLVAYQTERALSDAELAALPLAQIHGCLGFWLARLQSQAQHGQQEFQVNIKPPAELAQRLRLLLSML